jgi:alkylation response protein AidB-like acyl-CoA dehydrogenase
MTASLTPPTIDVRRELLDRARRVAPELRERAAEGESLRTMPADLAATVKHAGLFRIDLPEELGGWEAEPLAVFETIETLAEADGSGAWTVLIGNTTTLLAWLALDAARELLAGDPDLPAAGTFAPLGRATPTGDGFRVTGRWPFASGSLHSELLLGGVLVMDGDTPRIVEEQRPDWRFAWFRRDDVEVIDTWHAAGLRGTGSNDISVHNLYVPQEHTCAPIFTPARCDRPLYRLSFYNLLAPLIAGFASGVGRHALTRFVEIAQSKRRGTGTTLRDDEHCHALLGQADTQLRAARAHFVDAVSDAWATVAAGDECSLPQRASIIGGAQLLLRSSLLAADTLIPFAGATAVADEEPLQRCLRDLQAARQHIFFAPDALKRVGRVALGLEQKHWMF